MSSWTLERARAASPADSWAAPLTRGATTAVALLANGNFNPEFFSGAVDANLQQYVVLALWLAIIFASYFRRPARRVDFGAGLALGLSPYALAMISTAWSESVSASVPKAMALAIAMFGAWRLVLTSRLADVLPDIARALLAINFASILASTLAPDIALSVDYYHPGAWQGVFESKQTLGFAGALALFLESLMLLDGAPRLRHGLALIVALVCVIGSGSRGAGALSAVAVLCLFTAGRSAGFARALAMTPLALGFFGAGLISYFLATGNRAVLAFDTELDFTGRTFIWQHALSYYKDAPFFGFGLNGFWTLNEVRGLFLQRYGWFLDNYHDGYIAILMETGAVGLALFLASYFAYGLRLWARLRRDGGLSRETTTALTLTVMIFFIDLTETYFLRSTSLMSTILIMSYFIGFSQAAGHLAAGRKIRIH